MDTIDNDDRDQVKRPSPEAPTLTAQEARQARWGRPVLWILVIGTAAASVAVLFALGVIGD